ncbi:unnamed protein product [Cyprideis torosa]|uniref:Phospholipase A2-like central domain-containing protein n=1 Tax=Cyprideis torosa TaxID=163714 RepID=A0A7R8ZLX3_9CRUS|nr:unnamed protein product [Cyprideis torosa]CAG0894242.1 unnamed protein product [Cyprideis torosa]
MSSSVPLWIVLLATTVFSMVGCLDSKNVHQLTSEIPDYEVLDQLTNGERELRVHFKGMYAKDTTFDSLDHGQRFKLRLVQASDGYRFIQAIYDRNDVLSDCEYVKDVAQSFEFIEFFKSDIDALFDASDNLGHLQKNFTLTSKKKTVSRSSFRFISDRQDLSDRASEILNYHRLRKACKKLHMTLMSATRERSQRFGANGIRSILRRRRRDVDEEEEEEEEEPKEGMTIMPGTLWCGAGNISPKFTDLGAYTGADLCCREHDHCPSKLGPFEKKFGLLNLRPHTILHCHCDERQVATSQPIIAAYSIQLKL